MCVEAAISDGTFSSLPTAEKGFPHDTGHAAEGPDQGTRVGEAGLQHREQKFHRRDNFNTEDDDFSTHNVCPTD